MAKPACTLMAREAENGIHDPMKGPIDQCLSIGPAHPHATTGHLLVGTLAFSSSVSEGDSKTKLITVELRTMMSY
uniref:Uncharacterized protein n=2 Tax=Oryza TaxID=4527 RepID=Q2QZM1_ORYSJ|nr:hypothetical protein LOC_Os11g45520 [Oryza sativa Japonica Group]BBF89876.1 hypothetical protein [Oryza sativa f. spontanea]